VLADSLVVADDSFAADVAVFPDRIEIPTAGHEALIAKLHDGSVIASTFSAQHPERNPAGFLRHVVSVQGGATTVITTTQATLDDVVIDGDLKIQQPILSSSLAPDGSAGSLGTQSLHPLGLPPPGGLNLSFPDLNVFNAGAYGGLGSNSVGGGGKVTLSGMSVRLAPNIDSNLDVSWRSLQVSDFRMAFTMGFEAKAKLSAEFEGEFAQTLKEGNLFKKETPPRVALIGELPVVYRFEFKVDWACEAFAAGAAEGSVSWHMFGEPTIGTEYKNGAWSQVGSPTDFTLESEAEASKAAKIGVRCSIIPKFEVKLYETGGVYVGVAGTGKLFFKIRDCKPPEDIELDASVGGDVRVGAEAEEVFQAAHKLLVRLYQARPLRFITRFIKWVPEEGGPKADFFVSTALPEKTWKLLPRGDAKEGEECEPPDSEPEPTGPTKEPPNASSPIFQLVDSCKGRADGVYCSQIFDFSAIVCKDQSIQYGLQCANAAKCLGPNGPGTLQCEGQSAPPPPTGGSDAGAPAPDSCAGRPDGTYCSTASPYSAFVCVNGSTAGGQQCASGKMCVGPNGPGAIVCQ
jgi:hypothetical protein